MCLFGQSLITLLFALENLSHPEFQKNLIRKLIFLRHVLGSTSIIWESRTNCCLEILHQFDKSYKTKDQNCWGLIFCICRSYRGKIGKRASPLHLNNPFMTIRFVLIECCSFYVMFCNFISWKHFFCLGSIAFLDLEIILVTLVSL